MRKPRLTRKRAFELGAVAMRQLAMAKCGNLTESLQEDLMTSGGLSKADKIAMKHQVEAIFVVERDISHERPADAAYYGSYILPDSERDQIRELFPEYPASRPPREKPRKPADGEPRSTVEQSERLKCGRCNGEGTRIVEVTYHGERNELQRIRCDECDGTGRSPIKPHL